MKNKLIVSAFLLLALTGLNLAQTNKNKALDPNATQSSRSAPANAAADFGSITLNLDAHDS